SLAFAAQATRTLHLGTLLDTPVLRHPSVLAGSISTVAQIAPGRVHLGLGIGDTAVRFNGLAPATVRSLEDATRTTRSLLAGNSLDVGVLRRASLDHASPVPVWIATQGPKTLRMAGRVADGVWIRVGTDPANLINAWTSVCDGAREAGRDPKNILLGVIFHTIISTNRDRARTIGKAIAAGYYEYSPFLFDAPGFQWSGEPAQVLSERVWPDFHHHKDLVHAGRVVDFLDDDIADAFALHGDWEQISAQLQSLLELDLPVSIVLPHPIVPLDEPIDFIGECAQRLLPAFV
ncbi:MAG: LLM class flavin-dependent oxidoreductase, partial [Gammaproteobacteria bacterium]|nr:LLM class flavin-dependent oxidoreductase [Gammaproteobacteria bacterium]